MTEFLFILCSFFLISYSFIHFLVWKGLKKLSFEPSISQSKFSIIIAARNEEKNIAQCLTSLIQQHYPKDFFEIIVVNDRSSDNTLSNIKEFEQQYSNIHSLTISSLSSDLPLKKNALNEGIKKSKFDILVFTDADSIAPPTWLQEMAKAFSPEIGVVAGYSPFAKTSIKNSFGKNFLRYEEMKNSLGAAAGIGLNKAYMCTGRNFAYRKSIFEKVGGFEKIKHSISGDDDLFIQLVQKNTQWKMRYLTSPESFVETQPPKNFQQFLNQRKRHFSTGKYYPLRMKIIFSAIHLFNISTLITLFVLPFYGIILLVSKFLIDIITAKQGKKLFHEKISFIEIIFYEVLLVLYNLLIGPLGFIGKFEWKGTRS